MVAILVTNNPAGWSLSSSAVDEDAQPALCGDGVPGLVRKPHKANLLHVGEQRSVSWRRLEIVRRKTEGATHRDRIMISSGL